MAGAVTHALPDYAVSMKIESSKLTQQGMNSPKFDVGGSESTFSGSGSFQIDTQIVGREKAP